jgi:hypothetical protein
MAHHVGGRRSASGSCSGVTEVEQAHDTAKEKKGTMRATKTRRAAHARVSAATSRHKTRAACGVRCAPCAAARATRKQGQRTPLARACARVFSLPRQCAGDTRAQVRRQSALARRLTAGARTPVHTAFPPARVPADARAYPGQRRNRGERRATATLAGAAAAPAPAASRAHQRAALLMRRACRQDATAQGAQAQDVVILQKAHPPARGRRLVRAART